MRNRGWRTLRVRVDSAGVRGVGGGELFEFEMKGAYRFFNNEQVNLQTLLQPHVEATIERVKEHGVVLAVQDTTSLNYTAHAPEEANSASSRRTLRVRGVGPINTTQDSAVGLLLHDTLAFTVEGTPLGLLDLQCWARDPEERRKGHARKELPIEQKESLKWLKSYRAVAEVQANSQSSSVVSGDDVGKRGGSGGGELCEFETCTSCLPKPYRMPRTP